MGATLVGGGLLALACGQVATDSEVAATTGGAPGADGSGGSPAGAGSGAGQGATSSDGLGGALVPIDIAPPPPVNFAATGRLNVLREYHSATLLPDGRVLVAGGQDVNPPRNPLESAELYDPESGRFTSTGSLLQPRSAHSAVLLESGKVLVVGGAGDDRQGVELYDPESGTFSATGSLLRPRLRPAVVALGDGRVLVAGDADTGAITAELYDPDTETFTATGDLVESREAHSATLLPDGRVLIAGGANESAELYDPDTGTFAATGGMAEWRNLHAAMLLPDGRAYVAGLEMSGSVDSGAYHLATWSELYDSTTEQFAPLRGCDARLDPTATLLADGSVLVTGGQIWIGGEMGIMPPAVDAWRHDPLTGTCEDAGTMASYRGDAGYSATLLNDGTVLFAGVVNPAERCEVPPPAGE